MSVIMFAVGRSGSGKSTAIRHVTQLAEDKKCSTIYVSDYAILLEMSKQPEHSEKFRSNEYNGFDVRDFSVMDLALEELVRRIKSLEASQKYDVILVEFARDTYIKSFQLLRSASLLTNAYIIFIEAELETCIERIYRRVFQSQGPDYHFLSGNVMRTYFGEDNFAYFNSEFARQFDIQKHHLKVVCNQSSVEVLKGEAADIATFIFEDALWQRKKTDETENTQQIVLQEPMTKVAAITAL